jgi:putative ABC transport system permease protein
LLLPQQLRDDVAPRNAGQQQRRDDVAGLQDQLGATAGQVTAGLSMVALLPALPAAIIGIPLGIAVYHVLTSGTPLTVLPAWQLAGVFLATLLAVTVLTAIPSRLAARHSPARILQTE